MKEDLITLHWNTECKFYSMDYPIVTYRGKEIVLTGKVNSRTKLNVDGKVSELYNELDEVELRCGL